MIFDNVNFEKVLSSDATYFKGCDNLNKILIKYFEI